MSADPFGLARFLEGQARNYERALAELRAGSKQTHWSWYIFPQLAGLGESATSIHYAIRSLDEARAFFAHPLLGPRLHECVATMNAHAGALPEEILGDVDAMKFHSCVSLFARVAAPGSVFQQALDLFFGGRPDPTTLALLESAGGTGPPPA